MALPMESIGWRRLFLGNATEVELDGSSRMLIAPALKEYADLSRDVYMLGMGSCLEVWDKRRYQEQETLDALHADARIGSQLYPLMDSGGQWQHTTVLLAEAIESLLTTPDGVYVDGTFGRGGHSRALLARLSPRGPADRLRPRPGGGGRGAARASPMRASRSITRASAR